MTDTVFIPAGYLYKKIVAKPAWVDADVTDIYSVSSCISANFADYINFWQHNGYWLFDKPSIMEAIAANEQLDLAAMQLFYYEVYEKQFDYIDDAKNSYCWQDFAKEVADFPTQVELPNQKHLMGFDLVTFSMRNMPECSPLSCDNIATEVTVNKRCLFDTFVEAKQALEQGLFKQAEEGPYRIFAVYKVNQP